MSEFADKVRSLGVIEGRSRPREGRREDGVSWKATTDETGATVTEHADGRQDLHVRVKGGRATRPARKG